MKRNELQTGMLVQVRNGEFYRVMLGTKKGDILIGKNSGIVLTPSEERKEGYSDNLTMLNFAGDSEKDIRNHREFDIMKVWEPDTTLWGFMRFEKFDFNHLTLIFNRIDTKTINVFFKSIDKNLGGEEREYTANSDGSIVLIGDLFGIENSLIPKEIITYNEGIPESVTLCIAH